MLLMHSSDWRAIHWVVKGATGDKSAISGATASVCAPLQRMVCGDGLFPVLEKASLVVWHYQYFRVAMGMPLDVLVAEASGPVLLDGYTEDGVLLFSASNNLWLAVGLYSGSDGKAYCTRRIVSSIFIQLPCIYELTLSNVETSSRSSPLPEAKCPVLFGPLVGGLSTNKKNTFNPVYLKNLFLETRSQCPLKNNSGVPNHPCGFPQQCAGRMGRSKFCLFLCLDLQAPSLFPVHLAIL